MSNKKMAYICEISNLEPIEGKDRIVLASFSNTNWRVIVQKDQFNIKDRCIYIETESILPLWPQFQFLEKRCFSVKYNGYKIKTMKMGGVISEGICFTLKDFDNKHINYCIDQDLTEQLQIRRVEDEVCQAPEVKKNWFINKFNWLIWKLFKIKIKKQGFVFEDFPSYLIKTDETQAQSIPQLFERMKGKPVYGTLKLDGQSLTFANYKNIFTISTRNRTIYRAKINKAIKTLNPGTSEKFRSKNNFAMIAAKYDIPSRLFANDFAVQGEFCGPGIQKNRMGLKDFEFYAFNLFDINKREYFSWKELIKFSNMQGYKGPSIPMVTLIFWNTFEYNSIKELEEYASTLMYENGTPAEGVVIRSMNDGIYMSQPHTKMHAMCSFKMINPKFKLKYQEEE